MTTKTQREEELEQKVATLEGRLAAAQDRIDALEMDLHKARGCVALARELRAEVDALKGKE